MDTSTDSVIKSLSALGFRITKLRRAMVEWFFVADQPASAHQVIDQIKKRIPKIHRSSIYRELDFLVKQQIIQTVFIDSEQVYYELASLPHHHHFACLKCGQVAEVQDKKLEKSLQEAEKNLAKKGMHIETHELALLGKCQKCWG